MAKNLLETYREMRSAVSEEVNVPPKNLGKGQGQAGQHTVDKMTVQSKTPEQFFKDTSTYQGMKDAITPKLDTTVNPNSPKPNVKTSIVDRVMARDKADATAKAVAKANLDRQEPASAKYKTAQQMTPNMSDMKKAADNARSNVDRARTSALGGWGKTVEPNMRTRATNLRYLDQQGKTPALDTTRDKNLDQPATNSPMAKTLQAQNNVPKNMSGGSGDYRTASKADLKPAQVQGASKDFDFTDDERKGKVSKQRLDAWKAEQQKRGVTDTKKLGLGNFLNAAQAKNAKAGGANDRNVQQKALNTSLAKQKAFSSASSRGGARPVTEEELTERKLVSMKDSPKINLGRLESRRRKGQQGGGPRRYRISMKEENGKKKVVLNFEPEHNTYN